MLFRVKFGTCGLGGRLGELSFESGELRTQSLKFSIVFGDFVQHVCAHDRHFVGAASAGNELVHLCAESLLFGDCLPLGIDGILCLLDLVRHVVVESGESGGCGVVVGLSCCTSRLRLRKSRLAVTLDLAGARLGIDPHSLDPFFSALQPY